jgi:hypothetical protein
MREPLTLGHWEYRVSQIELGFTVEENDARQTGAPRWTAVAAARAEPVVKQHLQEEAREGWYLDGPLDFRAWERMGWITVREQWDAAGRSLQAIHYQSVTVRLKRLS